jgi:hypothetical protein
MNVYGDLEQITRMLRPTVTTEFTDDIYMRLHAIQVAVSAAIEDKLGRSFGVPIPDTGQLVFGGRSSVLVLPVPARSIASVSVDGTVSGQSMTGGRTVSASEWVADPYDLPRGLIYGMRLLSGGWWGDVDSRNRPLVPVLVTGDFADSDNDGEVPEDIQYVANYLVFELFKNENTSAAGQIGVDVVGSEYVPPRNPWNDPLVKSILRRHRATMEIVV